MLEKTGSNSSMSMGLSKLRIPLMNLSLSDYLKLSMEKPITSGSLFETVISPGYSLVTEFELFSLRIIEKK